MSIKSQTHRFSSLSVQKHQHEAVGELLVQNRLKADREDNMQHFHHPQPPVGSSVLTEKKLHLLSKVLPFKIRLKKRNFFI